MNSNILKNFCLALIFGVAIVVAAAATKPFIAILAMVGMLWFCSRALKEYFDAAKKEYDQSVANIQAMDLQLRREMIEFYKLSRADEVARLKNNVIFECTAIESASTLLFRSRMAAGSSGTENHKHVLIRGENRNEQQVDFSAKAAEFIALAKAADGMKTDIHYEIVSWQALYRLEQALENIASASAVLGKLQKRFVTEMDCGNVASVIANIELVEKALANMVAVELKNDLAFAGRNLYMLSIALNAASVASDLALAIWGRAELEKLDEIRSRCDVVAARVREWIDPARPKLEFAVVKNPFQSGMQWFGADWRFEVLRYEEGIQVMSQTYSTGFSAEKYEKHFTSEWL